MALGLLRFWKLGRVTGLRALEQLDHILRGNLVPIPKFFKNGFDLIRRQAILSANVGKDSRERFECDEVGGVLSGSFHYIFLESTRKFLSVAVT